MKTILCSIVLTLLIIPLMLGFRAVAGGSNDLQVIQATNGPGQTLEQAAKQPAKDIFSVLKPLQFLMIPLVTVVIQLARKWVPMIPDTYWPFISPFLGATIDYIAGAAGLWTGNAAVGALFGGLGVWFHQLQKQAGDPLSKLIPDNKPVVPDSGPAMPPKPTPPAPPIEQPGDRIVD